MTSHYCNIIVVIYITVWVFSGMTTVQSGKNLPTLVRSVAGYVEFAWVA